MNYFSVAKVYKIRHISKSAGVGLPKAATQKESAFIATCFHNIRLLRIVHSQNHSDARFQHKKYGEDSGYSAAFAISDYYKIC